MVSPLNYTQQWFDVHCERMESEGQDLDLSLVGRTTMESLSWTCHGSMGFSIRECIDREMRQGLCI